MPARPDLSVVIATRNRADILDETLRSMCAVVRGGLRVQFVLVDNGSTDRTRQVIESYAGRLPMLYLHEPTPGKNRALNLGLTGTPLGDLVVFADDDVTADPQWLREVWASAQRHPEHGVFGGRIRVQWPTEPAPSWALTFAAHYGDHQLSSDDSVYPPNAYPFGANFWVRGSIIEAGARFLDAFGPKPSGRIMGGETTFLAALVAQGHAIVHCPRAVVSHRVQPNMATLTWLRRRVFLFGRSSVHNDEAAAHRERLHDHPARWLVGHSGRMAYCALRYARARVLLSGDRGIGEELRWLIPLGNELETLRRALEQRTGRAPR